jgi:sugar lactone lactonase YvrE
LLTLEANLVTDGFVIGEGPRWHDGRLWFSDIFDGKIYSTSERGDRRLELETDRPSGLGWLPDGSLLVATLSREADDGQLLGPNRLLRHDGTEWHTMLDMSDQDVSLNDMLVTPDGRAYLDFYQGPDGVDDQILLVSPDGEFRAVASGLSHPNGMAITANGKEFMVCETYRNCVTAFDVEGDGSLSNKRTFASDLDLADGLCVDSEGAVWVGCLFNGEFIRVDDRGMPTHRVCMPQSQWALAPMLGGEDRRTLFTISADTDPIRSKLNDSRGSVWSTRVDVPGAGCP